MDVKKIEEIAKETGMAHHMYDRPRLQDIGDNMMGFVASGSLTRYGEKLIKFANAIEKNAVDR
jgi:hypothetical protein